MIRGLARRALARRAHDAVLDWVLHYTRDLPGRIARDRFDEVSSDLWEQGAADRHGGAGARFAAAVLARSVRGAPADLAWRRAQLEAVRTPRAGARLGRHGSPTPRRWVPLGEGTLFDQTNGTVPASVNPPDQGGNDVEQRLLGQAAASNTVNVGFFSGF